MTTEPKKPKRLRRVLVILGIIALTLFVGIPTGIVLRTRFQLSSALRSSSTVRLEEYSFGKTLTSRTLTADEVHHVTDAVPITFDVRIPGLTPRCFVPHHRVVFTTPDQQETTFAVCFSCAQVRFSGSGNHITPASWHQPLRQLFLRHDIPIRDRYTPDLNTKTQ